MTPVYVTRTPFNLRDRRVDVLAQRTDKSAVVDVAQRRGPDRDAPQRSDPRRPATESVLAHLLLDQVHLVQHQPPIGDVADRSVATDVRCEIGRRERGSHVRDAADPFLQLVYLLQLLEQD